jgi:DNA modification methylase
MSANMTMESEKTVVRKETTAVCISDLLPGQFVTIKNGDCRTALKELAPESIQCVVTSPPYWGLRDYGHADQIGQEATPEEYVENIRLVFAEIRRVLRKDGTCWLNLGDSYFGSWGNYSGQNRGNGKQREITNGSQVENHAYDGKETLRPPTAGKHPTLKPKDLCMIPARVALALQADGWWLRSDIIWAKANCMPESVTDRPTRSHEYIFLLTKSDRYYYDHEAIKEPCIYDTGAPGTSTAGRKARAAGNKLLPTAERNGIRAAKPDKQRGHSRRHDGFNDRWDKMEKEEQCSGMRNKRDVWNVAPANYPEAHFATFPPDLIKPCILAGTKPGDVVLDPFGGSGTTGMVALELGRRAVLVELNPEYTKLCDERCTTTRGLPLAG